MAYVIQRNEDAKFTAPPGQQHSYTRKLQAAWTFPTREAAQAQACGNETVVSTDEVLRKGV